MEEAPADQGGDQSSRYRPPQGGGIAREKETDADCQTYPGRPEQCRAHGDERTSSQEGDDDLPTAVRESLAQRLDASVDVCADVPHRHRHRQQGCYHGGQAGERDETEHDQHEDQIQDCPVHQSRDDMREEEIDRRAHSAAAGILRGEGGDVVGCSFVVSASGAHEGELAQPRV